MAEYDALRKAREFIAKQKGEFSPSPTSEEELNPDIQDDASFKAYALESTEKCYPVQYNYPQDADHSDFRFFEDGKQRTIQIGYIPAKYGSNHVLIPVHYFMVSAVILKREEKQLRLWQQPEILEGIFVAKSLVPEPEILEEFENKGLTVIDTKGQGGDYYELRRDAIVQAKAQRLKAEDSLIRKWRNSPESEDQFLVVDGTLMNLRDEKNVDRCIGVSKSFGTRYFSITEQNIIMQMDEFERSWTFQFHAPEEDIHQGPRERVSWYLRLRKHKHSDPEFGLIRVEISRKYSEKAAEYANYFSCSLISERFPTSYPLPRWDKHLYPIKACEDYLSSVMPSIETINASMKG